MNGYHWYHYHHLLPIACYLSPTTPTLMVAVTVETHHNRGVAVWPCYDQHDVPLHHHPSAIGRRLSLIYTNPNTNTNGGGVAVLQYLPTTMLTMPTTTSPVTGRLSFVTY